MTFRTYREVLGRDRSGLAEQVGAQRTRVTERLGSVGRVVAVMSGKGGVGKSYVTAGLAIGVGRRCAGAVGVLDADLNAPTAARMLGASGRVIVRDDAVEPVLGIEGIRVFSMDLLLEEGQPLRWREPDGERFVWRGALETGALREFLSDVRWGSLDLLLVDLPPGAAWIHDLAELVPDLAGAIAVTIPTEESRRAVERTLRAAVDRDITLLGVIENMSGYECDGCGSVGPLFEGNAGQRLAHDLDVPLLGRSPFRKSTDGVVSPTLPDGIVDAFLGVVS